MNLRELIEDISEEYDLLDGTCKLSLCHHKMCMWRRDICQRVYAALAADSLTGQTGGGTNGAEN